LEGTWLNIAKTSTATGPSLISGENATGSARRQPAVIACDIRYIERGPGVTAAANP
jgi:hypothetical protein